MCFGFGSPILVPANAKASVVAHYLRLVLVAHFMLALMELLSTQYIGGIFDFFGVLIGYMALRKREGFAYQQVLCYTVLSVIRFIISVIYSAISFADSKFDLNGNIAAWQFYIAIITYCAAPIIFSIGIALGVTLFKELKNEMNSEDSANRVESGQGGGGGMMSGMFGQSAAAAPPPADANGSYQAPLLSGGARSEPPPVLSGFRAFAGQGHRLG